MFKKKPTASEIDGVQYRRAKLWQIICYACNGLVGMSVYSLIGMASYSASIGYGITTAAVGIILTCSRILDGITDPLLAFVYDRVNTKFCLLYTSGEVQQRRNRFNTVRLAAGNDLAVMLDFGRVELALLRLDTRPFDGKAIGVQPGIRQQSNIFLIPIIMVAGNAARLGKAGVGQLLLCPVVGMNVVALDLMGGSGRADKETFFKFLHNFLLTCAV